MSKQPDSEDKWQRKKSQVIEYLKEGWSINLSIRKAGIDVSNPDIRLRIRQDLKFREKLKPYRQFRIGFHSAHDRLAEQADEEPSI